MPQSLVCPHGHRWESERAKEGAPATCPICGTAPSSPTVDQSESTAAYLAEASPTEKPVSVAPIAIPGYEILGVLGRGGMGVVYKARHIKLKRLVALKMVLAGAHAGPNELERFRLEAEAVARLQHANIVQIHEIGEQEGRPYFSLEYVEGGTLSKKLAGNLQAPRQAAQMIETLARAMHVAHEHGIVHRDLKPGNVLLTHDGIPKVADFGLAKQLDADQAQTQTGAIMGTPSYMAPEQALGKIRDIGPASDVYALGAILYEMLTGRAPFRGESTWDTLEQVRTQEPVPPRQLQPKAPRDLETICLKCLQKDPAKRYGSAASLADDLQRFLNGEPIQARPVGQMERLLRWCGRKPALAASSAAALLGLLMALAVFTVAFFIVRDSRDNAIQLAGEKNELANEKDKLATDESIQRKKAQGLAAANLLLADKESKARKIAEGETKAADIARKKTEEKERLLAKALEQVKKELFRFESMHYIDHIVAADNALKKNDLFIAKLRLDQCRTDFRHIEHEYLRKQLAAKQPKNLATFGTRKIAFSADGKRLFSCASRNDRKRNAIEIWDVEKEQPVLYCVGHASDVLTLALSADGKRLYSGSFDKTIKVWDSTTGKEIFSLLGHQYEVADLAPSADGKRLVSVDALFTIKVWDLEARKEIFTLGGHKVRQTTQMPAILALSADGKHLYSQLSPGPRINIWDLDTREEIRNPGDNLNGMLYAHDWVVCCLALSTNVQRIYLGGEDKAITVYDLKTHKRVSVLYGHTDSVRCLALSADGKRLYSGSDNGEVKVWDLDVNAEILNFRAHSFRVESLVPSADGKRVYANAGGGIQTWNLEPEAHPRSVGSTIPLSNFVSSQDGKRLFLGNGDAISIWDTETNKEINRLQGHTKPVRCLALSVDGKRLYSGSEDATIKAWDLALAKETFSLPTPFPGVSALAVSADEKRAFAVGDNSNLVKGWRLDTGKEFFSQARKGSVGEAVAVSASGMQVCWGGR